MGSLSFRLSFLLFVAGILLSHAPAANAQMSGPFTYCYNDVAGGGGTTVSCLNTTVPAVCPSAGSLITVFVMGYQSSSATVADGGVNTYHLFKDVGTSVGYHLYVFDAKAASSACIVPVATFNTSLSFVWIGTSSFTGQDPISPEDVSASSTFTTNAATQSCPNVTTSVAGDLLICMIACNVGSASNFTAGSGYSIPPGPDRAWKAPSTSTAAEYKIVGAAGSYSATFADSVQGCVFSGGLYGATVIVAFKPGVAAPLARHQIIMSYHNPDRSVAPWSEKILPFDDRKRKLEIANLDFQRAPQGCAVLCAKWRGF